MFYCQQILSKQGVFGTIWIIGTLKNAKSIPRKQLHSLHVTKLCDRVREPMSALALRTRAILLFGIVVVFAWHCEATKSEAELFLMSRLKSFPNHTLEGDGTAPESSITLPSNPLTFEPFLAHPTDELPDFNDDGLLVKPVEPPETEIMRFSVQNTDDITLLPSLPQDTPLPSSNLDLLSTLSSISFSSLSHNEEQPVAVVFGDDALDVVPDIPLPEFLSKSGEEMGVENLPQKELFSGLPPMERKKRTYIRKTHEDQTTELSEQKMKKYLQNTHKITGRTRKNKLMERIDDDLFETPTHFFHPTLTKTLKRSMEASKLIKLDEDQKEMLGAEIPLPQYSPRTEREQPRSDLAEPLFQEDFLPPIFLEKQYMMEETIPIQKDPPPQEMEESQPETLVSFTKDTAKLLRHLQKKVPGEAEVEFTSCLPRAKRGTAAKAFYHLMELTSISAVAISQPHHYGPITLRILLEITKPTPAKQE